MAGIIASKTGYYLVYVFLFTVAVIFASKFAQVEVQYNMKLENMEDSVVVNRIIRCFSEEGKFGIIDKAKFDQVTLKKCFGNFEKYNFMIELINSREQNPEPIEIGDLNKLRQINRYVLVDDGKGFRSSRLEVSYNKNEA